METFRSPPTPARAPWLLPLLLGAGLALVGQSFLERPPLLPTAADRSLDGSVSVEAEGATPVRIDESRIVLRAHAPVPRVRISNRRPTEGSSPVDVELVVTNLNPDVVAVDSGHLEDAGWTGPTTWHARVRVAPGEPTAIEFEDAHPEEPARFFVASDPEMNFDALERFLDEAGRERPAFVWLLGDLLMERDWIADTYLETFERAGVPVYVAIGNHDLLYDRRDPPYDARKDLFRRTFGPTRLGFDFRGLQFLAIDTGAPYVPRADLDWLEATISAAPDVPRVVLTHKPFLDPREGKDHGIENRLDADRLQGILAAHPPLAYYCGHIAGHWSYEVEGIPVRIEGTLVRRVKMENGPEHSTTGYLDVRFAVEDGLAEERIELAPTGVVTELWRIATTAGDAYGRRNPGVPAGCVLLALSGALGVAALRRRSSARRAGRM